MPKIIDNIHIQLNQELREAIKVAYRGDFCVGYFNLRGWKEIGDLIEGWPGGEGQCVRLLVGMQRLPQDELKEAYRIAGEKGELDNATKLRLKKKLAEEFRNQLTIGAPTNSDEATLRLLARQIKGGKVAIKLYLSNHLHAKLYLLHRNDYANPIIGFLGSSNLTMAGLSCQGELNVDVLEGDAAQKLATWFEDRWNDWGCVDISDELVKIIDESWAREEPILPYHIYIKMAYHLSQEARAGLNEFRIPKDFGNRLFDFQTAAVKIAAHHLNKRGGVLIGDVVGLGKTLMATALARIFEDDQGLETLIICPKNLVSMWEKYREQYRMRAKVLAVSRVQRELPNLSRYRLVILDESHNLRNREGRRYHVIRDYIQKNESRCILLSATPYNKTYLDLSNQLRLFVPEDKPLGIRPERKIKDMGEIEFIRTFQCSTRTLAAFEKSEYADDWRELMRLYMVRRTRSFILQNYAKIDPESGRKYLKMEDGSRSFFPTRVPRALKYPLQDLDKTDQYALLYSDEVVGTINDLNLPRYGLGQYVDERKTGLLSRKEKETLQNLSRAGKRLMGFCRTGLFKRLESSGEVFLQSLQRHILRNYIFLYALENNLPVPIGTQDAALLDSWMNDEDVERTDFFDLPEEDELPDEMIDPNEANPLSGLQGEAAFRERAAGIYQNYSEHLHNRFNWLPASIFSKELKEHLRGDAQRLMGVLDNCETWDWRKDAKLQRLIALIQETHPDKKIIIFTQFADTVNYLEACLKASGVTKVAGVVGSSADPTDFARRFSPVSNDVSGQIRAEQELRVLVATDVLSEGQNLQDGHIVVNYDLPWAIVRLIQRAGRVDRIGQKSDTILCYSFLPAEGVERIIRLRARVRQRLHENAEVVGTDETFFEDDQNDQTIADLYSEKAGIMDGEDDKEEVDLASYAYQIWHNATKQQPGLRKIIEDMPAMVFSTKAYIPAPPRCPNGVLVYARTGEDTDALAWVDEQGNEVTESQLEILHAAECTPDTPALPKQENHHELVRKGVEMILKNEKSNGGQLGNPSSARFRVYERLKNYAEQYKDTLFVTQELLRSIDDIYHYPLREVAKDILNRQLKSGIQDFQLAELVVSLREDERLSQVDEEVETQEPKIICSLGLSQPAQE